MPSARPPPYGDDPDRPRRGPRAGYRRRVRNADPGLRIGVKTGGCAGMEYTLAYAEAAGPADEVVEDKGVTVLIEPKAVLYLLGTQMDFITEKMSQRFVFNNPNQTSACGCGESVAITPALTETYVPAA